LVEEIAEYIAEHEMKSLHYLQDEDVIKAFPQYKKKHIKKALEVIR